MISPVMRSPFFRYTTSTFSRAAAGVPKHSATSTQLMSPTHDRFDLDRFVWTWRASAGLSDSGECQRTKSAGK